MSRTPALYGSEGAGRAFLTLGEFNAMPNHLKMCGCKMCRSGMRHRPRTAAKVKQAVRRLRRSSRVALQQGEEPLPVITVGEAEVSYSPDPVGVQLRHTYNVLTAIGIVLTGLSMVSMLTAMARRERGWYLILAMLQVFDIVAAMLL